MQQTSLWLSTQSVFFLLLLLFLRFCSPIGSIVCTFTRRPRIYDRVREHTLIPPIIYSANLHSFPDIYGLSCSLGHPQCPRNHPLAMTQKLCGAKHFYLIKELCTLGGTLNRPRPKSLIIRFTRAWPCC